jgi:hypothetical protein
MQPQLKLRTPDRSHGSKKHLPNDPSISLSINENHFRIIYISIEICNKSVTKLLVKKYRN